MPPRSHGERSPDRTRERGAGPRSPRCRSGARLPPSPLRVSRDPRARRHLPSPRARAESLGLLGTKADLAGLEANWAAYFEFLTQMAGIAGMILLSVIASYVFGREYAEGTAKNMLALSVPRNRRDPRPRRRPRTPRLLCNRPRSGYDRRAAGFGGVLLAGSSGRVDSDTRPRISPAAGVRDLCAHPGNGGRGDGLGQVVPMVHSCL